mmetsp:Transcript_106529/g.168236  ORF Transcript_106529/g.168236 Transcript_106529/m.168236 type:complete len:206 (+) Transcript_106529:165-782(+)
MAAAAAATATTATTRAAVAAAIAATSAATTAAAASTASAMCPYKSAACSSTSCCSTSPNTSTTEWSPCVRAGCSSARGGASIASRSCWPGRRCCCRGATSRRIPVVPWSSCPRESWKHICREVRRRCIRGSIASSLYPCSGLTPTAAFEAKSHAARSCATKKFYNSSAKFRCPGPPRCYAEQSAQSDTTSEWCAKLYVSIELHFR